MRRWLGWLVLGAMTLSLLGAVLSAGCGKKYAGGPPEGEKAPKMAPKMGKVTEGAK